MDHLLEYEDFLNESSDKEIGKIGRDLIVTLPDSPYLEFYVLDKEKNEIAAIRIGKYDEIRDGYWCIETVYINNDSDKRKGIYSSLLKIVGNYLNKKEGIQGFVSYPYSPENDQKRSVEANKFWRGIMQKDQFKQVTKESTSDGIFYFYKINK